MTAGDWKEIEEKLKSFYSIVKLRCDGYEISIVFERVGQFKNAIVVYVGGKIKGEWLMAECEESRRFFRKVTRSLLTQKQKAALKKMSKKFQNEFGLKSTYSYYTASWTSFKSLKKHLVENNKSIELIEK